MFAKPAILIADIDIQSGFIRGSHGVLATYLTMTHIIQLTETHLLHKCLKFVPTEKHLHILNI